MNNETRPGMWSAMYVPGADEPDMKPSGYCELWDSGDGRKFLMVPAEGGYAEVYVDLQQLIDYLVAEGLVYRKPEPIIEKPEVCRCGQSPACEYPDCEPGNRCALCCRCDGCKCGAHR